MILTQLAEATLNEAELPMNPEEMQLTKEQLEVLLTFAEAQEV